MEYISSSRDILPETVKEWEGGRWWNLWARKYWPYHELAVGDIVYWYESPSKSIVWKSQVTDVRAFPYSDKVALRRELHLSKADADFYYFRKAPDRGYCLLFWIKPLKRIDVPKPPDLRVPQLGWVRIDRRIAKKWLGKSVPVDNGRGLPKPDRRGGGFGDPETNKEVERAAERIVGRSLRREGWQVTKMKPGCGYDLSCRRNGHSLHVEVKGVQGTEPAFNITAGEVRQAGRDRDFRLSAVTSALTKHPRIFDYSGKEFVKEFDLNVIQYRAIEKK